MKILRYIFSLSLALATVISAMAQEGATAWSAKVSQVNSSEYQITITANIDEGYHIYELGPNPDCVVNPTLISFEMSQGAELVGSTVPSREPHTYYDDMFMADISYYENTVDFTQNIKVAGGAEVAINIEWMACNEETCTPICEEQLKVVVGNKDAVIKNDTTATSDEQDSKATNNLSQNTNSKSASQADSSSVETKQDSKFMVPLDEQETKSLWALIIEAILWGFAALLTPCVFPMIPMTVSFFMKGDGGASKGRFKAMLYGLFIVLLYTLPIAAIIIITRTLGGDAVTADIFNWLATHWFPNLLFFTVFIIFAASFFGAFEITLPSWLVNKSDEKADRNSIAGIFFLALTLVLVSFSCTGPIVGSVLIKSTAGEFWNPILTMLAFSTAFALPFALFAFFPSTLKSLPKSGGWLNSVKVVLGFIELALGMKFLSVADQTYHWGLLDREIYLAIWIVIFTLLGFYLLGKLKFAHDSELKHLSVGRLGLSIAAFSFVVYMIPGMFGAPLKGLSGYLPPMHTQDFVMTAGAATPIDADMRNAKYSDFLHLPHNLSGFFDMEEATAYAEKVGKPIFVDITGHGCVNCREMEARVWSDERVLQILRDEYVLVALYTDDKTDLPESEWVVTSSGKTLKGLGKINSNYALETYGVNAQPYYILQDADGSLLNTPRGYNLDVDAFIKFLEGGVKEYKSQKNK